MLLYNSAALKGFQKNALFYNATLCKAERTCSTARASINSLSLAGGHSASGTRDFGVCLKLLKIPPISEVLLSP
jgi:hypothetical protein